MRHINGHAGLALALILVLAAGLATAQQIPHKINYQGRVTHIASGVPLPGTHSMTFRIYDVEMGGAPLWEETQTVQADFQGVVSTILGDVVPIDLTFEGPYWLEVVVDGETLTPRREMVSSGYAYNAERLGGLESTSYSLVDHTHHFLDAADGSPAEAVYVDDQGYVGVGITNPTARFHIQAGTETGARLRSSGSEDLFTVEAANDAGTAGGFFSVITPVFEPPDPAAVYAGAMSDGFAGIFFNLSPNTGGGLYTTTWGQGNALEASTIGSGYSGYFNGGSGVYVVGSVNVTGDVNKSGGTFKIDHPLDPANKYLYHSFVESPDRKNVYDGVVELDALGEARVDLPDWFGTLNRDFRYQLTAIGAAGPNLHVASEIENNHFTIAGGSPGMKVSWQVTGIRQDPYAVAHPLSVEVEKTGSDRGKYLHPELYGRPETETINYRPPIELNPMNE